MAVTRSRWTRTTSCRPHRRSRSRWHSRCGCQISTGELDPGEHLPFTAERAPLLRDGTIEQAVDLMLRLSDNVATNVLLHRVTRERIMTRLSSLGLTHTTISHDVLDEVADITARLDKLARAAGFTTGWKPTTSSARVSTTNPGPAREDHRGRAGPARRTARADHDSAGTGHALPDDLARSRRATRSLRGGARGHQPPGVEAAGPLLQPGHWRQRRRQGWSAFPGSSSPTPASSLSQTGATTPPQCSPAAIMPSTANSPATS